jgi:CheY-like chemotaxis protein
VPPLAGRGVSPAQLERLFVRFRQVSTEDLTEIQTRGQKGTGLGLSIVKMLAEKMGGSCGMSSMPGEGSECWFTVKLRKVALDGPLFRRESATCKVLVSHRLASVGAVLCRYLAEWGYDATMATGADDIFVLLRRVSERGGVNGPPPFGLVVVDGSLLAARRKDLTEDLIRSGVGVVLMTNPGMTHLQPMAEGLEAVICRKPVRYVPFFEAVSTARKQGKALRAGTTSWGAIKSASDEASPDPTPLAGGLEAQPRSDPPNGAMSAPETPKERSVPDRFLSKFEDHLLPDPVVTEFPAESRRAPSESVSKSPAQIPDDNLPGSVVDHADSGGVQKTGGEGSPVTVAEGSPVKRRTQVLVVEDHIVNQRIVCTMLRKMEIDVDVANNGLEAVAAAERKAFDVILMDCQVSCSVSFLLFAT